MNNISPRDLKRLFRVEAIPLGVLIGSIITFAGVVGSRHLFFNSDVTIAKTDRYRFTDSAHYHSLRSRQASLDDIASKCHSKTPFDDKDLLKESQ